MKRIVINPTTFRNGKDALCVAFNERFRIWMEEHGFEPTSEPTDAQRRFFRDTAYADDEVQLRRTILARIATLDTSVKDPTDDQLVETLDMLMGFKGTEQPTNDWERNALDRIIGLVKSVKPSRQAAAPKSGPANATAGDTDENPSPVAEELPPVAEELPPVAEEVPAEPTAESAAEPAATSAEPVAAPAEPAAAPVAPAAEAKPAEAAASAPAAAPAAAQAAPVQEQKKEQEFGSGTHSGVWTGGKPGKGREMTGAEAKFAADRAARAPIAISFGGNDTLGNPLASGVAEVEAEGDDAAPGGVPKNPQASENVNAGVAPIVNPIPKAEEKDKKKKK